MIIYIYIIFLEWFVTSKVQVNVRHSTVRLTDLGRSRRRDRCRGAVPGLKKREVGSGWMGNLHCMGTSFKHTFTMILNVTNQQKSNYDISFQVQDSQLSGITNCQGLLKNTLTIPWMGTLALRTLQSQRVWIFISHSSHKNTKRTCHFNPARLVQQLPSRPLTCEVNR